MLENRKIGDGATPKKDKFGQKPLSDKQSHSLAFSILNFLVIYKIMQREFLFGVFFLSLGKMKSPIQVIMIHSIFMQNIDMNSYFFVV